MALDMDFENQSDAAFSERMVLGTIGFIFYTAGSIATVYSEIFVTALSSSSIVFGSLRSLAFGCMALVYLAFFKFLKKRDAFVRSNVNKTLFFALQLMIPLAVLAEKLFFMQVPLPLVVLAWICWGCSNAFFACSWVDRQSNLEEPNMSSIGFWSFTLAGCIVVGVLSMTSPMNIFVMIAMNILSFAVLLRATSSSAGMTPCEEQWIASKSIYSRNGSYIMLVDGALIGIVACCLILWIADYGLAQSFMGSVFLVTALVFYILRKRNPALLSLEHSQLVFLPVLVCGLLFMEFAMPPWQILFAFVLLAILYLFDYTNSTILSLRGNLLSISACYCFSKGRIFMTMGQCVGWACGAFLNTEVGMSIMPLCVIALVAFLCLYITVAAIYPEKYPLIISSSEPDASAAVIDESDDPVIIERPYKQKCSQTAAAYDLTPREGEILFYLAKGRNAKYIADRLFVAERTIKTHMYHIYQKLGTHSQQELIDKVESIAERNE